MTTIATTNDDYRSTRGQIERGHKDAGCPVTFCGTCGDKRRTDAATETKVEATATERPWRAVRECVVIESGYNRKPGKSYQWRVYTGLAELVYIGGDGEHYERMANRIAQAVNSIDSLREREARLRSAIEDELEALRVWLSNKNNATDDVREGMLISRSKLFAALDPQTD